MARDAVVVGAGIVGLSAAYYLARQGARVAVVERAHPGHGATGASGGMLAAQLEPSGPGPLFDLAVRGRDLYTELAEELLAETGIDIQLTRGGILALAPVEAGAPAQAGSVQGPVDEGSAGGGSAGGGAAGEAAAEAERLRDALRWQTENGQPAEWWAPAQVAEYVPGSRRVLGGLYAPRDGFVVPEAVVAALAAACQRLGVEILSGVQVTGFVTDGTRVTGVRTDAGTRAAGHVVLAAGVWSSALAANLGLDVPVTAVRGQILVLAPDGGAGSGPWRTRGTPVYSGHSYLIPRRDGRVLVGATVELGEWVTVPTPAGLAHLAHVVRRVLPALEGAPVAGWRVGLRPGTPDGLPVLGRVPEWQGLVLATGHFRNGILLGPLTGQVVAQLCAGQKPDVDLAPFSIERFAARRSGPVAGG